MEYFRTPQFSKSYDLYDFNLLFIRWLADFCGVDMMVDNYKPNYRTVTCGSLILFQTCTSIYCIFLYYPDVYKMCEVVLLFGILLQSAIKFYYGFIHRHFYRKQYERLQRLHYKYRNHEGNNAKLLLLMQRIHLLSKIIVVVYCFGGFGYTIYPVYMYWTRHERVLMFAAHLPWIDPNSHTGYIITMFIQLVTVIIGSTGISCADTVILLFVASLSAYVDVFTNELEELNVMINAEIRDEKAIRKKVRLICTQHQEIIEYESDLDERYITICFVQVISSIIGISVSLFLVYMVHFIPGYGVLFGSLCQLLEFCLLGTVLTVKNEEIIDAIYSTHWYSLRKPEQKCFALMLHKSQIFTEMTVGGFAPLNVETFVAIMNRIYSYFMMLINFIE